MMKTLKCVVLAILAVFPLANARAASLTNVLQNISLQLTVYQQGTTNTTGTKIADKVSAYSTKSLIAGLQSVTGVDFGTTAKLVQNTIFSNVTFTNITSNNLAVVPPTNLFMVYLSANGETFTPNQSPAVLSNNTWVAGPFIGSVTLTNNLVTVATNSSISAPINTNVGYETTFTPQTNGAGLLTNIAVVSQLPGVGGLTETVFTNLASTIEVLYTKTNALYPVGSYFVVSTNSPEIFIESGSGLNNNPATTPKLAAESSLSISNLVINYFSSGGNSNLGLNLQGFVKQSLKVDTLARHGTNIIVEDLFGANSTWSVIGSGYMGGTFSTNGPGIAVTNLVNGATVSGFLSNTIPVVVQGTVTFSFLENLAQ